MMIKKFLGILAVLSALLFVSCSEDDPGEVIAHLDNDGNQFSPSVVLVHLDYLSPRLSVSEVKVVRLDYDYNPVDTISTRERNYYSSYDLQTDTVEFYSPYVKILVNAVGENSELPMTFEYYMDLVNTRDSSGYRFEHNYLRLDFARALASERIEYLVKEKDSSLAGAVQVSYDEVKSVLENQYGNGEYFLQILCRSTQLDSLYYHDFNDLKKAFAKGFVIPDSIMVRAADFLMERSNSLNQGGCNALLGCNIPESNLRFMRNVFQLDSCTEVGILDTIRDSLSIFDGKTVGCFKIVYSTLWRTLTEMEEVEGICTDRREAIYEGKLYGCSMQGSLWEEQNDSSKYKLLVMNDRVEEVYGKCKVDVHERTLRYVNDTLYMCSWGGAQYNFSGYIWGSDEDAISSVYGKNHWLGGWISTKEAYADADAALEAGNCTRDLEGKKIELESGFYRCEDQAWRAENRTQHYVGECDSSGVGKKGVVPPYDSVPALHMVCDGTSWIQVAPWEYYGDVCDQSKYLEVFERDSSYFWCNGSGFESIDENNKVPPTFDKKPCFANNSENWNQILKYDDQYYTCTEYGWRLSQEKELKDPVKAGYFCDRTENLYSVVEVDGKYYLCNYNNTWGTSSKEKYQRYVYTEEHKDYCNKGITGTSLLWNENENSLYGCAKDSTGKEVQFMKMATGSTGYNKYFAGGKFVNDSIYQVKVDDFTFELQTVLKYKWYENLRATKVYEGSLDDAGYKYDPWSTDSTIYIHSKRSADTVLLSSISNKSASFDSFYADFLNDWECGEFWYNEKPKDGTLDSIKVLGYTDQTFMDYESAVAFCPKGYHIPDTTEWATNANYEVMTYNMLLRGDSPLKLYMTWNGVSGFNYKTIFWTRTAKDDDTQYCVEYAYNSIRGINIECPKDLYPLVQAMCIRD